MRAKNGRGTRSAKSCAACWLILSSVALRFKLPSSSSMVVTDWLSSTFQSGVMVIGCGELDMRQFADNFVAIG